MTDRWGEDPAIELGPTRDDPADPVNDDRPADDDAGRPMASTAAIAEAGDREAIGGRRGTAPGDPVEDREARAASDRPADRAPVREPAPERGQAPERGPRTATGDGAAGATASSAATPLFDESATRDLRGRWGDIQAGFVDEPRSAVEHADALVAEVMKRLAEGFASERSSLEEQWSRGGDVSTEELRLALQRYRSFFDRLLSV